MIFSNLLLLLVIALKVGRSNSGTFLGCRYLIQNGQKERGTTVTRYIKGKSNFHENADLYDDHRKAEISEIITLD